MENNVTEQSLEELVVSQDPDEEVFYAASEFVFSSSSRFQQLRTLLYGWEEEDMSSRFETKTNAALMQGFCAYLNYQLERAEELLRPIKSSSPWASYWLLKTYASLKNWDNAVTVADVAKEKFPECDALQWLVAEVWISTGWESEARKLMKHLSHDDEKNPKYCFLMGQLAEMQGSYEEACEWYEKAVELNEKDVQSLFRLGFLHSLHGSEDDAIEYYERCIEHAPVFVNALINLGILYEDKGRFTIANACFETVLQHYPTHERAKLYRDDTTASLVMYYDRDKEKEMTKRGRTLNTPISDFELSVRSRNCLNKMNIETLGDLIVKTEQELLAGKNFGETSLAEVKAILRQKGLRLGQGLEEHKEPKEAEEDDVEKGIDPELLNRPVDFLNLSIRSRRCMERLSIYTIKDLIHKSEVELMSAKNFGVTSLKEIKKKLTEFGLKLKDG